MKNQIITKKKKRKGSRRISSLFLFCLFFIKAGVFSLIGQPPDNGPWKLHFHSGFEGDIVIEPRDAQITGFKGTDSSVPEPNDWTVHMDRPPILDFDVFYEQGDLSQREATIVKDPTNPDNRVLKHEIRDIHVKNRKCRIQCQTYPEKNLRRFYYKYRFYLAKEWHTIKNWKDELSHVIENEFWSGTPWRDEYSWRLHTKIEKEEGAGKPFHFGVSAEIIDWPENPGDRQTTLDTTNKQFDIPIETWITVEFYAKEGDENNGRLYYAVTPEGGEKTVIFDLVTLTTNPHDPNPDGFQFINMLKSYFRRDVITYLKSQGEIYVIYWDDFELYVPEENYEPI